MAVVALVAHVMRYAAALAVGAALAWGAQGWRMGEQAQASKTALESLQREHAEALTRATASALNATLVWQKAKDDALDRAQQRAKTQAAHAAAARRDADSLRSTLASASLRLPDTPPAAVADYAAALTDVFAHCSAEYGALAAQASGHASDVQALSEACAAE